MGRCYCLPYVVQMPGCMETFCQTGLSAPPERVQRRVRAELESKRCAPDRLRRKCDGRRVRRGEEWNADARLSAESRIRRMIKEFRHWQQ
jgi:hypothetical protein